MRNFYLLLLISLSGCFYTLVKPGNQKVYVDVFTNQSLQPQIETAIYTELKKTFAEKPGFTLVWKPAESDISLSGKIIEFSRKPDFFSKDDEILMAAYHAKMEITVTRAGTSEKHVFEDNFHLPLTQSLTVDFLLREISIKLADQVYFFLLKKYD